MLANRLLLRPLSAVAHERPVGPQVLDERAARFQVNARLAWAPGRCPADGDEVRRPEWKAARDDGNPGFVLDAYLCRQIDQSPAICVRLRLIASFRAVHKDGLFLLRACDKVPAFLQEGQTLLLECAGPDERKRVLNLDHAVGQKVFIRHELRRRHCRSAGQAAVTVCVDESAGVPLFDREPVLLRMHARLCDLAVLEWWPSSVAVGSP